MTLSASATCCSAFSWLLNTSLHTPSLSYTNDCLQSSRRACQHALRPCLPATLGWHGIHYLPGSRPNRSRLTSSAFRTACAPERQSVCLPASQNLYQQAGRDLTGCALVGQQRERKTLRAGEGRIIGGLVPTYADDLQHPNSVWRLRSTNRVA